MKRVENGYELSTGKVFYANCGILGISQKLESGWVIHEGFDGSIFYEDLDSEQTLTKAELEEIADFAISLWMHFKIEIKMGMVRGIK